ncbi:MAG: hypothetical protein ABIL58_22655 [Pseudomonadota bacterium]
MKSNALNLLLEDDDYIVQAVWGPMQGKRLDQVQCDINNRINLFVTEIGSSVIPNGAHSAQEFAIEFLIREKILYNISFLLERGRRLAMIKNDPANSDEDLREAAFNAFADSFGNA